MNRKINQVDKARSDMDTKTLNNTRVLVTRPNELADKLCDLISDAGGHPIRYPAIEIRDPSDINSREFVISNIHAFDIAIFISPTAVTRTMQYLPDLPETLRIAAIGSRTAETLAQSNINTDILPEGHDSESLLAHIEMQDVRVKEKKIIIFRGEGGRMLLGDTLTARGANVVYAEMYQRVKPQPEEPIDDILSRVDIVATTSNEGLLNLLDMVKDKSLFRSLPLIVPGERCEKLARSLEFKQIIVAENATDSATMDALLGWSVNHNQPLPSVSSE